MIESHLASERIFRRHLWIVTLIAVVCVAGLAFEGTAAARRLLLRSAAGTALVSSGPSGEGALVLGPGGVDLGTVQLDSTSRYLLRVVLGPGAPVTLIGRDNATDFKVRFRCPRRGERQECQRLLEARELPEHLGFRAASKGQDGATLYQFQLTPLSRLYSWFRPLLLTLLWLTALAFLLAHRKRLLNGPLEDLTYAVGLFALCLWVFHSGTVKQVVDSRYLTAVSHSLIHGHGPRLPADLLVDETASHNYQVERVGDKLLHYSTALPALLDAPIVALYESLGVTPQQPGGIWDRSEEIRILRLSAALVAALLCVVLYVTARRYLPPLFAGGLTLAFAFGTQVFSTLSRPYWSHTWAALLGAAAICLVIRPWPGRPLLSAGIAATLASLSVYCRPQTFWTPLALLAALALLRDWRRLTVFAAVGFAWVLIGISLSLAIYDAVLPAYFYASQVKNGWLMPERANQYWYGTGALGALVSPGRGLFVYSPIFLWVLLQVLRGWRKLPSRLWAFVSLLAILGLTWLLVYTGTWPGGQSYGARLFSDTVIWFFLLAVLGLAALRARWGRLGQAGRWVQAVVAVVLLSASVFINARGAYSKATWSWDSFDRPPRWATEGGEPPLPQPWAWNWRYPQFMAGLLPTEEPEAVDPRGRVRNRPVGAED